MVLRAEITCFGALRAYTMLSHVGTCTSIFYPGAREKVSVNSTSDEPFYKILQSPHTYVTLNNFMKVKRKGPTNKYIDIFIIMCKYNIHTSIIH